MRIIISSQQINRLMETSNPSQQFYKLIHKTKAPLNVDCIKRCPFNRNVFAFAYYEQQKEESSFLGGISIEDLSVNPSKQKDMQFNVLECGPVLHICWLNEEVDGKWYLVGAQRSQKLLIFSIQAKKESISPEKLLNKWAVTLQKQIFVEKNIFCLYVDALVRKSQQSPNIFDVIVSTNQSEVFRISIDVQNDFGVISTQRYKQHQYAVWTCRFSPFESEFACGDECNNLYRYSTENSKLTQKDSNSHQQGVCDILYLRNGRVWTGGFDGYVNHYLILEGKMKLEGSFKLGGTIWRVIPEFESNQSTDNKKQLKILICNSSEKIFQIIDSEKGQVEWDSGEQHGSLTYAADWSDQILLTASFYDKVVCVWKKNQSV